MKVQLLLNTLRVQTKRVNPLHPWVALLCVSSPAAFCCHQLVNLFPVPPSFKSSQTVGRLVRNPLWSALRVSA